MCMYSGYMVSPRGAAVIVGTGSIDPSTTKTVDGATYVAVRALRNGGRKGRVIGWVIQPGR